MSGTLQVGGITLGTHNSGTGKVDLTNAGDLKVEKIQDSSGSNTLVEQSGDNWAWGTGVPSGSIVQVQHTQLTTAQSMQSISANTEYVLQQASSPVSGGAVSGILDVNITPRIAGSKIWLQTHIMGEMNPDDIWNCVFFFWRSVGSTHTALKSAISGGTVGHKGISIAARSYNDQNADSTPEVVNYQYFDTHGVSAGTQIIYKVGLAHTSSSSRWDINACINGAAENGISSICAIELAP